MKLRCPTGMEGLDGYRIVQIADLHSAKLDQELEQALEQLQPHLIVMTGDLVNREDRDFPRLWLRRRWPSVCPYLLCPGQPRGG